MQDLALPWAQGFAGLQREHARQNAGMLGRFSQVESAPWQADYTQEIRRSCDRRAQWWSVPCFESRAYRIGAGFDDRLNDR